MECGECAENRAKLAEQSRDPHYRPDDGEVGNEHGKTMNTGDKRKRYVPQRFH